MAIDFYGLMYLIRSEYRDDAAFVIKSLAENSDFRAELNGALDRALRDTEDHRGHASGSATEHVLRDAFWRLEQIGRLKQPSGYARFEDRVNLLLDLAQKLDASRKAAIGLLYEFDANGMPSIQEHVRAHVQEVLSLLEFMGSNYLADPDRWSRLIYNASFDLLPLNGTCFDDPPDLVHERMRNTLDKMLEHRSSQMDDRLCSMPARIEAAFREGRDDDLRKLASEAWVDVIDIIGYYDEARNSRIQALRNGLTLVKSYKVVEAGPLQGEGAGCIGDDGGRPDDTEADSQLACSSLVEGGFVSISSTATMTSIALTSCALAAFPCTPMA